MVKKSLLVFFVLVAIWGCASFFVIAFNSLSVINLLLIIGFAFLMLISLVLSFSGKLNRRSWMTRFDLMAPWFLFPLAYSVYYGAGIVVYPAKLDLLYPVSLGLFMYYIGLFVANLNPVNNNSNIGIRKDWKTSFFYWGMIPFYLVSILALSNILARVGFVGITAGVQTDRTLIISKTGGYLYYLGLLGVFPMILSVVYTLSTKASHTRKSILFLLFGLNMFLLALLGYRAWVVFPLLSAIVLINYYNRKYLVPIIGSGILIISFYIAVYGTYRQTGEIILSFQVLLNVMLHELNVSASTLSLIITNFPLFIPFFEGRALLMPIVSILPGYNPILGSVLKESMNLNFEGGGLAATLLGGFYVDFGYSGIVGGMFVIGLLYGWLYRNLLIYRNEVWLVFYAYMLTYLLSSLRTSFLSDGFLPYLVIGSLWVFQVISRLR